MADLGLFEFTGPFVDQALGVSSLLSIWLGSGDLLESSSVCFDPKIKI